ncbi:MAG: PD-(D/E)XK nuclease family protein [Vicingaceae bacterium]
MNKVIDLNRAEAICKESNTIIKHYDEIRQLNGEDFNVYSLLGLEHAENQTHSNFLAELLNPLGTHRMGNIFLQLFLDRIGLDELIAEGAFVTIEKHIGAVDLNKKTGGRIDIHIEDKNGNSLSIENKIYAGDQQSQLERYVNYKKNQNSVFYLTLEGSDASLESKGSLIAGEEYQLISYKDDILDWLVDCQKEAVEIERIRSGIGHYIQLIRKLTNQSTNYHMDEKLKNIIRNNYHEVRYLADQIEEVEKEQVIQLMEEVVPLLKDKLSDQWHVELDDFNKNYHGLSVKYKTLLTEPYIPFIRVEGQSKMWSQHSIIGMPKKKEENPNMDSYFKMHPQEWAFFSDSFKANHWWIVYKYFLGWNHKDEREKLFIEQERKNNIDYIIDNIALLANEFEEALLPRFKK